jgi:hypothetical protein
MVASDAAAAVTEVVASLAAKAVGALALPSEVQGLALVQTAMLCNRQQQHHNSSSSSSSLQL